MKLGRFIVTKRIEWWVLHIKYLFLISFRFWQQALFLWQKNLYWLFQIMSFRKIIFGSVSDDSSVELENSVHWCSVPNVIFPFVSALALLCVLFSYRKMWLNYLSHANSPYLHRKLINWTSAFYLSCTVYPEYWIEYINFYE